MADDYAKEQVILDCIDKIALSRIKMFTADYVVKNTGVNLVDVNKCLCNLDKRNIVQQQIQIICPACSCRVEIYDTFNKLPFDLICPFCQNDIEDVLSCAQPIFMVNKEYKQKVKLRYSNKVLNKDNEQNRAYIRLMDFNNAMVNGKDKYYSCVDLIGMFYKENILNQAEYNELSNKILKMIDGLNKFREEIFKELCAIVDKKFGKDNR